MAKWYEDRKKTTYVATYENEKDLNRELQEAGKHGWLIKDTSGLSGHINVGRTATRVVLTGGLGLVFGGSRTKGKIIVTYERDPWIVPIQEAEASIAPLLDDHEQATKRVTELNSQCKAMLPLAEDDKKCAEQAKKLAEKLRDRGSAHRKASDVAMKLAQAIEAAHSIYNQAGDSPPERRHKAQELRSSHEHFRNLSEGDASAAKAYEEYARAVTSLVDSNGEVGKRLKRVDEIRARIDEATSILSKASEKDRPKAEERLSVANRDLEKAEKELEMARENTAKAVAGKLSLKETLPTIDSSN